MITTINIRPDYWGILYKNNKLFKILEPGVYRFFNLNPFVEYLSTTIPQKKQTFIVTNQEVLSKNNIAFRFSYFITYSIKDIKKFCDSYQLFDEINRWQLPLAKLQEELHLNSQTILRELISQKTVEEINEIRNELFKQAELKLKEAIEKTGISIEILAPRDITFPKTVQEILAKELEANIRAKTDLANARTQIATARALKNAASLIKGNKEIQFLIWLETLTKISNKGNHTFVVGKKATK